MSKQPVEKPRKVIAKQRSESTRFKMKNDINFQGFNKHPTRTKEQNSYQARFGLYDQKPQWKLSPKGKPSRARNSLSNSFKGSHPSSTKSLKGAARIRINLKELKPRPSQQKLLKLPKPKKFTQKTPVLVIADKLPRASKSRKSSWGRKAKSSKQVKSFTLVGKARKVSPGQGQNGVLEYPRLSSSDKWNEFIKKQNGYIQSRLKNSGYVQSKQRLSQRS